MMKLARIGAVCFLLWGLLHVAGGGALLAALSESPDQGFAFYRGAVGGQSALAGAILGYLAYCLIWLGLMVAIISLRLNWKNSEAGLTLNTALVVLTEIGLVTFLVVPGYVPWTEAATGLGLSVLAVLFGGVACRASAPTGPASPADNSF